MVMTTDSVVNIFLKKTEKIKKIINKKYGDILFNKNEKYSYNLIRNLDINLGRGWIIGGLDSFDGVIDKPYLFAFLSIPFYFYKHRFHELKNFSFMFLSSFFIGNRLYMHNFSCKKILGQNVIYKDFFGNYSERSHISLGIKLKYTFCFNNDLEAYIQHYNVIYHNFYKLIKKDILFCGESGIEIGGIYNNFSGGLFLNFITSTVTNNMFTINDYIRVCVYWLFNLAFPIIAATNIKVRYDVMKKHKSMHIFSYVNFGITLNYQIGSFIM